MVSLRIPEDHLLELDRLVGLDGMRNRSDVIRSAVRKYLNDEHQVNGERVEVNLGPDLSSRMEDFCKLHGEKPDSVLRQAAREHIRNVTIEDGKVASLISSRMNELRERGNDESNAI
jgi:metal-responsive CopG/Arc/MetJ family transcriptional regulator